MTTNQSTDWPIIMIRPSLGINISQITEVRRDGKNTDVYTEKGLFEIPDADFSLWSRITKDDKHSRFAARIEAAISVWSRLRGAWDYRRRFPDDGYFGELIRQCKMSASHYNERYPKP